jgi:hypothetical protein
MRHGLRLQHRSNTLKCAEPGRQFGEMDLDTIDRLEVVISTVLGP